MTRIINDILRSGYCTRWHANPDLANVRETLAEHHARVAQIIMALHPAPSISLINAALHHDCGEAAVGDVPWPVKRDNQQLKSMLDEIEIKELARLGINIELSEDEAQWLKLADRLSAYMHVKHVAPHLLGRDDWKHDGWSIMSMSERLGVWSEVAKMTGLM